MPINAPAAQSRRDTPVNPHAILRPDQGTIPIRRSTDSLTHAGVPDAVAVEGAAYLDSSIGSEDTLEADVPSNTDRVSSMGLGNKRVSIGARGAASNVEKIEPIVVRAVMTRVASSGWNSAPASTF